MGRREGSKVSLEEIISTDDNTFITFTEQLRAISAVLGAAGSSELQAQDSSSIGCIVKRQMTDCNNRLKMICAVQGKRAYSCRVTEGNAILHTT